MIELEYIRENDFERIIEWNKDKNQEFLMQWAGPTFKYPLTTDKLKEYFSNGINEDGGDNFFYKIVYSGTSEMIGIVQFGKIDYENSCSRIGRFLIGEDKYRGKGIGGQVLNKLLHIGFNNYGLHRITLGVFDFNKGAIKCYEKAGFKKDGLLRDSRKVGDLFWSLYEMSILEDEWKELNKNN